MMRRVLRALALLCAGVLAYLPGLGARAADTPVSLYQSFRGNVNFTGTEGTLRTKDNSKPCSLVSSNSVSATLSGVPSGATILSAQLYWAGSGNTGDYSVSFNGVGVTAGRKFTSATIGSGYNYFSGAADVTTQVKGNGTYTFSGLNVSTGDPWCSAQGVVGGFALVVVYSSSSEPFRMLNLYEGFQYFRYSSLTVNLGNFNVPNPLPSTTTGRVGHITWEGDSTLSGGGEDLIFTNNSTNYALTDSMNPSGNQFNSASNVTGDTTSYGIDFDIYSLTSPMITPGQTTASTTYKTGQDMVLLSAEIVAMPYVASADLALAMTRSGDLVVGSNASYTLTVTNSGVDAETGPVTIVDTLPAGLKLVSTSGTGWSCGSSTQSSGATVVTCTQAGPLASGAKMSSLTINVTPSAATNYTNTATVSGKTGDTNTANNTATNAGTATAPAASGSISAVFTAESCTPGYVITADPNATGKVCHAFVGPVTAMATTPPNIYVTVVSTSGDVQTAMAVSSSATTVSVSLAATCLPNSGVTVSYAGKTLDCKGTAQTVSVTLPGNAATLSGVAAFSYADVGRVTLAMNYSGIGAKVSFISRPTDIRIASVLQADGHVNQGTTTPSGIGFTKAGGPFTLRVGALMGDGKTYAPSFGKEPTALAGVLAADAIDLDIELDKFAPNLQASPVVALDQDNTVSGAFVVNSAFALNTAATGGGFLDANVGYFEAGYLALTPWLADYLGTGTVGALDAGATGTSTTRVTSKTTVVGRFYPDHFVTDVVENFACLDAMKCPTTTYPVGGATYSQQPFNVSVTPYGLTRDGKPTQLTLFQNPLADKTKTGGQTDNHTTIALAAVGAPNASATLATPLVLADATLPLPTSTGALFPTLGTNYTYALANPYVYTDPQGAKNAWTAPLAVYVRASMTDSYQIGTTVTKLAVTSSATAPTQYEDGVMVVSGRLLAPNAFGSELLRVPLPLGAQYWTGSAWAVNGNDNTSLVASTLNLVSCTRTLAASGTTCKTGIVAATSAGTAIQLNKGSGTLVLQAPGRPNVGSADYTVSGGAGAAWLPSTLGRATFGLYKSPVIYLREVY